MLSRSVPSVMLPKIVCFLVAASISCQNSFANSTDSMLCITATTQVERSLRLPEGFLSAMSRVETGRPNGDRRVSAWPWTINAAGIGYHYASLHEAVNAVRNFQNQGIKSIDVGCLQVNLMHHPNAFPTLEAAFDPYSNALYAGQFLKQMYNQKGSWPRAAAAYHSQTPDIGEPYLWHVIEEWSVPQDGHLNEKPLVTKGHTLFSRNYNDSSGNTGVSSITQRSPQTLRYFHPFKAGRQNFSSAPPHPHFTNNGPTGKTLASYRKNPVRMITIIPHNPSY